MNESNFRHLARALICALLVIELFVSSARSATAAPIECGTVSTLEQLIALGSNGCGVSFYSMRLYDFSYSFTGTAGADEVTAAEVGLTLGGVPSVLVLDFGQWTAEPGQTLAITLGYSFTGRQLVSIGQFTEVEPWYAPDAGAVTLTTALCLGDVFPCAGGTRAQLADLNSISIEGTRLGSLEMSLSLDGRLLDDVPITVHSAANVFAVPEPPLWALIGSALVPYVLRRRPDRPR